MRTKNSFRTLLIVIGCLTLLACKGGAPPEPTPASTPGAPTAEAAAKTTANAPVGAAEAGAPAAAKAPQPDAVSIALGERFPAGRNCTVEAVQAAVQPHTDKVKGCYQAGLQRNVELGGKLRMKLVVGTVGKAQVVEVAEDALGDDEVAACVGRVLKALSYAPSPAERPCTIVYPFDFQVSPEVREQLKKGAR